METETPDGSPWGHRAAAETGRTRGGEARCPGGPGRHFQGRPEQSGQAAVRDTAGLSCPGMKDTDPQGQGSQHLVVKLQNTKVKEKAFKVVRTEEGSPADDGQLKRAHQLGAGAGLPACPEKMQISCIRRWRR